MRPVRIVLTLLLAMSIAVLPAVGGAVSVAKAVESAVIAAEACCEHQATPCDSQQHQRGSMDDCASLAVCAAKCFVYSGVATAEVAFLEVTGVALTVSPVSAFVSHTDPPPSPPPRV